MKKLAFFLFLMVAVLVTVTGCRNKAFEKSQGAARQAVSSAAKTLASAKKVVPVSVVKDFGSSLTQLKARLKKARTVESLANIRKEASKLEKSIEQTEQRWKKAKSDTESVLAQAETAITGAVAGSDLGPANTTLSEARTKLAKAASFEDLKAALDLANQAKDQADKASAAKKAADEAAAAAFLIIPGASIGKIKLDMPKNEVINILGKPTEILRGTYYNYGPKITQTFASPSYDPDLWSLIISFANEKVSDIRTADKKYHTAEGIGPESSVVDLEKVFGNKMRKEVEGSVNYYSNGIAFFVTPGASNIEIVAVNRFYTAAP